MAALVYNKGEKAFIDGLLGGQSNYGSPVLIPSSGGNWGVGLGTRVGGIGSNQADAISTILEVGTATANGYARAIITRDQTGTGWPASTLVSTHYQSSPAQVSFSFTGAPSPNGATMWFLAGSAVTGADNALFGADLSATRTYGNGDQQLVTITYSQQ